MNAETSDRSDEEDVGEHNAGRVSTKREKKRQEREAQRQVLSYFFFFTSNYMHVFPL